MRRNLEHARATFLLAHINRYTLLVAPYTTEPRARPINVKFAPHAQGIPAIWRFDLDNLRAEMPSHHRIFPCLA